jgi:L-serine dehydratase
MDNEHPVDRSPSLPDPSQVEQPEAPAGVDRRAFLMRSAAIGAAAVLTGRSVSADEVKAKAAKEASKGGKRLATELSPNL